MVYAADAGIDWIMHVHAPVIWRAAARLELPTTPHDVAYGSPAMANAVGALLKRHATRPMLFATLGHEDGIFACGASADDTGAAARTRARRRLRGHGAVTVRAPEPIRWRDQRLELLDQTQLPERAVYEPQTSLESVYDAIRQLESARRAGDRHRRGLRSRRRDAAASRSQRRGFHARARTRRRTDCAARAPPRSISAGPWIESSPPPNGRAMARRGTR